MKRALVGLAHPIPGRELHGRLPSRVERSRIRGTQLSTQRIGC